MRVTDGMRYADVARTLARLQQQNAQAAQQASTGMRLAEPSDDPVAAAELARVHASIQRADSHRQAIQMVSGDAQLAESTLAQATDLLGRARELAMQGSNDTVAASDRAAMATEVKNLRTQLLGLANTRGSKGYIFAGSQTDQAAFDQNAVFQGDDVAHTVDIGGSTPTNVGASGARAFTVAGGRDIFADLQGLADALAANDRSGAAAALDQLDAGQKQVTSERANVGLVVSKLESSDTILQQLTTDFQTRESVVGAADPFEAYSKMTVLAQTLQRAVEVSRQVLDLGSNWK